MDDCEGCGAAFKHGVLECPYCGRKYPMALPAGWPSTYPKPPPYDPTPRDKRGASPKQTATPRRTLE